MSPARLITTRRSAPASSVPRLNALLTTARNVNKNSATAKDPIVKTSRTFLRNKLANINRLNFTTHPHQPARPCAHLPPERLCRDVMSYVRELQPPDRASPSALSCDTCPPAPQ